MKKMLYYLLGGMIGFIVFITVKNLKEEDLNVTYKPTAQLGLEYEIPDNFTEGYSTAGEYFYFNKSKSLHISAKMSDSTGVTLKEYVKMSEDIYTTGITSIRGRSISASSLKLNDCEVISSQVININGNDIGKLILNHKEVNKKKTKKITRQFYGIKSNDRIVEFIISCRTKDVNKYQDIIDHIVNSIEIP